MFKIWSKVILLATISWLETIFWVERDRGERGIRGRKNSRAVGPGDKVSQLLSHLLHTQESGSRRRKVPGREGDEQQERGGKMEQG